MTLDERLVELRGQAAYGDHKFTAGDHFGCCLKDLVLVVMADADLTGSVGERRVELLVESLEVRVLERVACHSSSGGDHYSGKLEMKPSRNIGRTRLSAAAGTGIACLARGAGPHAHDLRAPPRVAVRRESSWLAAVIAGRYRTRGTRKGSRRSPCSSRSGRYRRRRLANREPAQPVRFSVDAARSPCMRCKEEPAEVGGNASSTATAHPPAGVVAWSPSPNRVKDNGREATGGATTPTFAWCW